jgi:hypothetical protein
MSVSVGGPASWAGLHRLFRQPEGITESTRWLFAGLAMVSLALSLPALLSAAADGALLMGLAATLALAVSWICGYLSRRVPFGLDVMDAAAMTGFALACPDPATVLGIMLGSLVKKWNIRR